MCVVGRCGEVFDVWEVRRGNGEYRNKELFIKELKRKCKYGIEFEKKNLEG